MAKIKWGLVVTDGRGKLGGHVLSKNRSGAIVRTKVSPANAQTTAQQLVRNRLTTYSQGWRSLTQAQRDAWNAAVGDFQRTNVFGDLVSPSGFNLYQRLNNNIVNVGGTPITTPPAVVGVTPSTLSGIVAIIAGDVLTCAFSPTVAADMAVKVFATAPLSAGRNYVKSDFRQVTVLDAAETSTYDLYAEYVAKFGSIGSPGQKIFVKFITVNSVTGEVGTGSQASNIVSDT